MAGSLARTAASDAPQAAPAICEKPNKAAAAPALSPNGDSAAALDSGLAIPKPNRKIEAVTRNGSSAFLAKDREKQRDAADNGRSQANQGRMVEAEPRRQSWRQHPCSKHQENNACKQQTKRDRRQAKAFEKYARRAGENREQAGHQQTGGPGRCNKPRVSNQAEIATGNAERMHGTVGGQLGFADQCRIPRPGANGENGDKGKFGTPAEKMIKPAAHEGREPRGSRSCDRDQRHCLCQRLAIEQIPRNGP